MHRKQEINKWKREYTDINVETQMWEKPRQPTSCRIHYERRLQRWKHRGNDLLHLYFATRWLQWRQRPLSLSLSLSHSVSIHSYALYTYNYKSVQQHKLFCPKSYLYTYDFRAIYTYGPKGLTRTHSRMCPFQPVGKITTGS